jgi:hypothetical protein
MISFYISSTAKQLIITDYTPEKVRKRFNYGVELVNSIKDKSSLDIVKSRMLRTYRGYEIVELFQKPKYVMSPEHKHALLISKLGKPRSEEVRRKISETKKKQPSNFKGKKHTYETKRLMSARKIGNQANADKIWAYNPDTDEEIMVNTRADIPPGFSEGRDYYSVEPGLYEMHENNKRLRSSNR